MDSDLAADELERAATKIQATFKGYKVRKEVKLNDNRRPEVEHYTEADFDINDPEVEKAATKIQATFRGYKTRREVKRDN